MTDTPRPTSPDNTEPVAVRPRPLRLMAFLAWIVVVCTLAGFTFALAWPARLHVDDRVWVAASYLAFMIETFALHAGMALVLVALFALGTRRRALLALALVGALWGAGPTAMRLTLGPQQSVVAPRTTLRVLSMNLLYSRADSGAAMRLIEREKPDVVLLQEWTRAAEAALLPRLRAIFPHEQLTPQHDAFGQASFALRPMLDARVFPSAAYTVPAHNFEVEFEGHRIRFVNVHVLPPIGLSYFGEQRTQTEALAQLAEQWRADRGVVLAGDFNAVWSSGHGRRLRDAGLVDAQRAVGDGLGATWPREAGALRIWPGLALDHVLVGGGLVCARATVLEDVGSDHAPLVVDVGWGAK